MVKIPFDIRFRPQIESGEYKVETEAGLPATVMDWKYNDKNQGKCIAVKITEGGTDSASLYTTEGKRASIFPVEGSNLILITPEPELTEFEVKLWEIMKAEGSPVGPREKFTNDDKKAFHEYSAQLLALARKGIEKDLPRWKICYRSDYEKVKVEEWSNGIIVMYNGYYINITDLFDKLPKEEQL